MFVTYAECNGEVIMHSASSINPMCLLTYLASSPGINAPLFVRGASLSLVSDHGRHDSVSSDFSLRYLLYFSLYKYQVR